MREGGERRELSEARLADALERADRGEVVSLGFLTPGERMHAVRILRAWGRDRAHFWGGYPGAERTVLLLPPPYMEELFPSLLSDTAKGEEELLSSLRAESVSAVRVCGSGYRTLTHRDHLGALLGLGIERDVLGDVALQDAYQAVVFCLPHMQRFLIEELTHVASDTVRCVPYEPDATFWDGRTYASQHVTVASARLDCIVAALTGQSRESAQRSIRAGLVEVNYEACERVDCAMEAPATLSVRGVGRFELRAFEGETRKGRLRLLADRLV